MHYDVYVAEVYDGSMIYESVVYNSNQTDINKSIKAVVDFIKEHYSGCVYKQIKSLTEVKTQLEKENYYRFTDFDGHKITFILRMCAYGYLQNRDIVESIDPLDVDDDYESEW